MSIDKYFRANSNLETNVGSFVYQSHVGQGGNANVLKFRRGSQDFAVKFISHDDDKKLARFRDEFFLSAQIPSHKNVVQCFHLDSKVVDGRAHSLIVMKLYATNLNALKAVAHLEVEERATKAWRLFLDLCAAVRHLHDNHIIHRDIKPQNIFFDSKEEHFVVGDLGIANFKDEQFAREAATKEGERLANYMFSAPEQADGKVSVTPAADIYALGQVIQWYLTGSTVRGLGRRSFDDKASDNRISALDQVVHKSLQHSPSDRFQSIGEIAEFLKELGKPKKPDPWLKLHAFDNVIRRTFPEIRKTLEVADQDRIHEFLTNFQADCKLSDFWYVLADDGDGHFVGLERIGKDRWLLNNDTEIVIDRLLVYKDGSYEYKDFFILILAPDEPFDLETPDRAPVQRDLAPDRDRDYATIVDQNYYIDPNLTNSGYIRLGGKIIQADRIRFQDRVRYLKPFGLMVVPTETASASMNDRLPTAEFIASSVHAGKFVEENLKTYLNKTRAHHSPEITSRN